MSWSGPGCHRAVGPVQGFPSARLPPNLPNRSPPLSGRLPIPTCPLTLARRRVQVGDGEEQVVDPYLLPWRARASWGTSQQDAGRPPRVGGVDGTRLKYAPPVGTTQPKSAYARHQPIVGPVKAAYARRQQLSRPLGAHFSSIGEPSGPRVEDSWPNCLTPNLPPNSPNFDQEKPPRRAAILQAVPKGTT